MTFWQTIWKKQTKIKKSNNQINTEDNVIIQNFSHQDKKIAIFISKNKNIDLYKLEHLCDTVGWVRRPLKKVKIAIDHSFLTISLFYKKDNKSQMIGFARATSDQIFNATIWDVVIHPEFQKRGLGKILMHEIIKQLRYHNINTITLFADPEVINFYKSLGFIADPDGIKGMFWYPN